MIIFYYCSILLILVVGVVSSYTDIKYNKIFNITLIKAVFLQILFILIFVNYFPHLLDIKYFSLLLINVSIALGISILLYFIEIWPAGDAKLFTTFSALMPLDFYSKNTGLFPSISLFFNIFSLAIIFIIFDSLIILIKNNSKNRIKINKPQKQNILKYLPRILFLALFCMIFKTILNKLFPFFVNDNLILIQLIVFLTSILLIKKITKSTFYIISIIVMFFILIIIQYQWTFLDFNNSINYLLIVVTGIFILFCILTRDHNYKSIEVKNLKHGMLLSSLSVTQCNILFNAEVFDSKMPLSQKQIDLLQKEEINNILIIRKIPFAPIIFFGVLFQLLIKLLNY